MLRHHGPALAPHHGTQQKNKNKNINNEKGNKPLTGHGRTLMRTVTMQATYP